MVLNKHKSPLYVRVNYRAASMRSGEKTIVAANGCLQGGEGQ